MEERMKLIEDSMGLMRKQNQRIEQLLLGLQNNGINNNINDGCQEGIPHQNTRNFNFNPKVEFPVFDGSNPRIWVKKCKKYFELCKVADNQKLNLASLYMVGKAESWVHSYMNMRVNGDWDDFVLDLCAMFKENLGSNIVEEFNKLQKTGSLEDYLDAFEHLRGLMLQRNELLPDSYFLDSFVGGLKPTTKPFVRALKPTTIARAVELARCQEESLNASKNLNKLLLDRPPTRFSGQNAGNSRFSASNYQNNSNTKFAQPFQRTSNIQKPPYKRLTPAEIEEKRKKNLCFQCDEPYTAGHKCPGKLYNMVLIPQEWGRKGGSEFEAIICGDNETEYVEDFGEEQPLISLNAIAGHNSYQTMRVQGKVGKNDVHILIDFGSTHNFCDENTARKLGCRVTRTYPLEVSVANGDKLTTTKVCKGFKWQLHGEEFQTDVMIVPLGGCEMVLGVHWLSSLGPVIWDFEKLRMEFMYKGRKVVLRGITKGGLQWISGKALMSTMGKGAGQLFAVQVRPVEPEGEQTSKGTPVPAAINSVLQEYNDIFVELKGLPPHRSHDHKIHLNPGVPPINVRPYRYPVVQKNAIEQITKEMLESGVVRPSQSPFSSPILSTEFSNNFDM
ncbi:uncharacterized protein LOC141595129 [Silene latifolia]|uniref:uncharacterized protein LOC141595129 n=1 Tax=Silene latifolia TaxID=37657 RepID=UPI003D77048B